jgi:LCP family protein required for cell wall assembly
MADRRLTASPGRLLRGDRRVIGGVSGYPVVRSHPHGTPHRTDDLPMNRRDRRPAHATETPRARRIREAAEREQMLRARGIDPLSPPPRRSRATTRRPRRWKRTLVLLLLIVLLSSCTGGWLLWQRVAAFNDTVSSAGSLSTSLLFPLMGSDRVNVAIYGYGGPEHKGGTFLADSIIILSIDPKTDTTTMIPIPRDLWIQGLPELPNNAKINEAFADGFVRGGVYEAGRAATAVLIKVTGLPIRHWMALDFTGFKAMVDSVGGVTVNNPVAFGYTWSENKYFAHNWDGGYFRTGPLFLNGTRALDYARTRYTSVKAESSDFARSVRQQRVLAALRGKLGGSGIGSLGPGLAIMDSLEGSGQSESGTQVPLMATDLSAIDLYLLSGHLGADRRIELSEGVILQATSNSIGQYILVVIGRTSGSDYAPLQAYIQTQLARPIATPTPSPSPSQP